MRATAAAGRPLPWPRALPTMLSGQRGQKTGAGEVVMPQVDMVGLVLRWMHILAALMAAGGTFFSYFALLPAVGTLSEPVRKEFAEQVRRRWAPWVMVSILFLLVSGLVNFVLLTRGPLKGYQVSLYHAMFGVKFLLALAVFWLASVLSGRSPATASFRQNARTWAGLNAVLIVVIVMISGVMRGMHIAVNPGTPLKVGAAVTTSEGEAITPSAASEVGSAGTERDPATPQ